MLGCAGGDGAAPGVVAAHNGEATRVTALAAALTMRCIQRPDFVVVMVRCLTYCIIKIPEPTSSTASGNVRCPAPAGKPRGSKMLLARQYILPRFG